MSLGEWNVFFDGNEDQSKTRKLTYFREQLRTSAGIICRNDFKDYKETRSPVYKPVFQQSPLIIGKIPEKIWRMEIPKMGFLIRL